MTFSTMTLIRDSAGVRLTARGDGISLATEEHALKIAVAFGQGPGEVASVLVVDDYDKRSRLVGSVRSVAAGTLSIRIAAVPINEYPFVDPFRLAEELTKQAEKAGSIEYEPTPPERREVSRAAEILKAGDSPLILGAVQVLLDGGRFAVPVVEAGKDFIRHVRHLMPYRSLDEMTFATLAFTAELPVDAMVVPEAVSVPGLFVAEALRCYPNGRYEQAMLLACEQGDQAEFDRLLCRKTGTDTLKLAMGIVLFALLVTLIMKLF